MTTLALDLGTTTGWATEREGVRASGIWKLRTASQARYEGGGMRFLRFQERLAELGRGGLISRVVYEEVRRHRGTAAAHIYGGLMGVLTAFCEARAIPYQAVPVGQIKRHATGKGNANKAAMIAAFEERTGRAPVTDDEADAWWLLDLALAEQSGGGGQCQA